jgi:hypothetical protein
VRGWQKQRRPTAKENRAAKIEQEKLCTLESQPDARTDACPKIQRENQLGKEIDGKERAWWNLDRIQTPTRARTPDGRVNQDEKWIVSREPSWREKKNRTEARGQAARAPIGNPRRASQQDQQTEQKSARSPSWTGDWAAGEKISGRILHRKTSGNTVRVRQNGTTRGRRKIRHTKHTNETGSGWAPVANWKLKERKNRCRAPWK